MLLDVQEAADPSVLNIALRAAVLIRQTEDYLFHCECIGDESE